MSVSGMSANSYETFPVSDAAWMEILQAREESEKNPEDEALRLKRRALVEKYVCAVNNKKEARFVLDVEKAAVLQQLVDRFAFEE